MKIGIVDADLIGRKRNRFPNLACMKMSAYHKSNGHDVSLLTSYDHIEYYDKVLISKVFSDTLVPDGILNLSWVEYGGTGFFFDKAPSLPDEIEHIMPDYDLYTDFVNEQVCLSKMSKADASQYLDYSIGFTTRGCIRGCSFCVNKNYRKCVSHSPISEFLNPNRKYIYLLDDNVLACQDWKRMFDELNATGKRFRFHQGMDERLLTPEKCEVIFNSNWIGDFIFAFDNIKDRRIVEKKLKLIREHTDKTNIKFYCFCGYNHDAPDQYDEGFWLQDIRDLFERIRILIDHRCLPYVTRHENYKLSPYNGIYIEIARWVNQPSCFKKKSFREFCLMPSNHKITKSRLNEFSTKHPDIASEYFDMKWDDSQCRF